MDQLLLKSRVESKDHSNIRPILHYSHHKNARCRWGQEAHLHRIWYKSFVKCPKTFILYGLPKCIYHPCVLCWCPDLAISCYDWWGRFPSNHLQSSTNYVQRICNCLPYSSSCSPTPQLCHNRQISPIIWPPLWVLQYPVLQRFIDCKIQPHIWNLQPQTISSTCVKSSSSLI